MKIDTKVIRARADAATAGPWVKDRSHISGAAMVCREGEEACIAIGLNHGVEAHFANTALIAHARADVPALCDRVEELEAALRRNIPVLERVASACCARVPADLDEVLDALDECRAALEGK